MDTRFNDIFNNTQQQPWNEIFQVVFFPDRIYHAQYLNATRSSRYRYNVTEVRNIIDVAVLKGEVYMDGIPFTNFLRIEYRASRLIERVREKGRFLSDSVLAWVKVCPDDPLRMAEETVCLHYCPWIDAYQGEIWGTLEAPPGKTHDFTVRHVMGHQGSITRVRQFGKALHEIKELKRLELAFRESELDLPSGGRINEPEWDNGFLRTHQEPNKNIPSSRENTVEDNNYLIDFQRGWFIDSSKITPVKYLNAMMDGSNRSAQSDNVIMMKWILQRELGGSLIFFHEVTIPPGKVEGTHRHIGTEELYYIIEGHGIAYMGENDDPSLNDSPIIEDDIYGLDAGMLRSVEVGPGSVIFTKSGGVHGIRNTGQLNLRFVAFLYHTC